MVLFLSCFRSARGPQICLLSPYEPSECADKLQAAIRARSGILSRRLIGLATESHFRIRQASAVQAGQLSKWADGTLETSNSGGSKITFRYEPIGEFRYIFGVIQVGFAIAWAGFVGALAVDILGSRPINPFVAFGILVTSFGAFLFPGLANLIAAGDTSDGITRLFCDLLEAQKCGEAVISE